LKTGSRIIFGILRDETVLEGGEKWIILIPRVLVLAVRLFGQCTVSKYPCLAVTTSPPSCSILFINIYD
jgi:hypothetical protein